MTVPLCVLRSGGDFAPQHVARLAGQFRAALPDAPMLCLTDMPDEVGVIDGVETIALAHGWPGWWSKIEALAMSGPCLLMDLDVSVVGDPAPLLDAATRHELIVCGSFWTEDAGAINTSVVGWSGDTPFELYAEFARAPAAHMGACSTSEAWGDQGFVERHWRRGFATWQDVCPGMVVSFKRGMLRGADVSDCRVLVSHGKPRPWDDKGADEVWS